MQCLSVCVHVCVPADRRGSDRALRGEVWGGEGLDDWQSVLMGNMRGKRHKGKETCRDREMRGRRMEDNRQTCGFRSSSGFDSLLVPALDFKHNIDPRGVLLSFWSHCDQVYNNPFKSHKSPALYTLWSCQLYLQCCETIDQGSLFSMDSL